MADEITIIVAKRKIRWEPAVIEEPAPLPQTSVLDIDAQSDFVIESKIDGASTLYVQTKRAYKKRVGNGHKSVKVRNLIDTERYVLRNELFIPKNGQIEDDDCVDFKQLRKWDDVGIFQITGFISVLHTDVASGLLQVDNLIAYEQWMRTKYGGTLWARYNLQLYNKTRAINASLISQGLPPVTAKKVKADDPTTVQVVNDQGEIVGIQASQEGIIIKPSTIPKFTSFRKRYAGA
jgi:hypothetical protein